MGAPTLWQHFRQTVGRAVRETGQALDRVGLRLASVAQTKYDFGDEPVRHQDFLSRHRQLFPMLAAGRPVLHPHVSYVAPCATLIGSVVVGKGASIWYGAVLRADTTAYAESFRKTDEELLQPTTRPILIAGSSGHEEKGSGDNSSNRIPQEDGASEASITTKDNNLQEQDEQVEPFALPDPERTPYSGGGIVIGENTNIQDGCILSARKGHCIVGQGVTVGHLAQIHSSTVGDYSLIGMGCILQEDCQIGSESLIAAGAVLPPGTVVPSGELWVGHPARKLRDLTAAERARLQYQSSEYVNVASTHRDVMELGGNFSALEDIDPYPVETQENQGEEQGDSRPQARVATDR